MPTPLTTTTAPLRVHEYVMMTIMPISTHADNKDPVPHKSSIYHFRCRTLVTTGHLLEYRDIRERSDILSHLCVGVSGPYPYFPIIIYLV